MGPYTISEITPEIAMHQAYKTAHDYFLYLREVVETNYPAASPDAKLAAITELCKVAAHDFRSWLQGETNGMLGQAIADAGERLAVAVEDAADALADAMPRKDNDHA